MNYSSFIDFQTGSDQINRSHSI